MSPIYKMNLPKELIKNLINIHGVQGKKWLDALPSFLSSYEKKWQFILEDFFNNASFNVGAAVTLTNGSPAVLKCSIPSKEFTNEIAALQHFNGIGAVKILRSDHHTGIMLLEKLTPGTFLEESSNEMQNTIISVDLMNKLYKTIQAEEISLFPSLANWFQGFDRLYQYFQGETGPFPKGLIDRAQAISKELLASMGPLVLLHGDLHYANILLSDKHGWLSIDPKGVIGEREYEIPFPRISEAGNVNKISIKHRLDQFIEVSGFDRQRILGWAFSKAALAAWWSFEDNGEVWQPFLDCAEILKI
ncbi:aminoglycoside phosphotransferase family protein [Rickettsiella endosymbiont of Miltochrista miniata]|uniref:aminoglycoside phosphotransferase family protein n=1 Tax=Rickettsiella endosymbiont of Miltochrista miniata TaxID=3066239 RepID=UPI00313E3185